MTTVGEPQAPRAWLYKVATNLVVDRRHTLLRTLAFIFAHLAEGRGRGGSSWKS